mgnify:CR=1 FL=1
MGLTKKLFDIVVLLLILIAGTLCVIYREPISDNIIHFLKNATRPEIVIPETNYNKRTYDFELLKETNNFEPTSMDDLKNIKGEELKETRAIDDKAPEEISFSILVSVME